MHSPLHSHSTEDCRSTSRAAVSGSLIWGTLAIAVAGCVLFDPVERTVTHAYRNATDRWLAGEPIYNASGLGFLYLPVAVLTFAPFAALPYHLSEIAWRWSSLAMLALAMWRFLRLVGHPGWFPLASMVGIVVAAQASRNGQATVIMTGLMLLGVVDLADRNWTRAAVWLCLAVATKPLAITLVLLVAAIEWRQMFGRLIAGGSVVLIAPFLAQRPDYVLAQYAGAIEMLHAAHDVGANAPWVNLFGLFWTIGIEIPPATQTVLRLLGALVTLGLCWQCRRRLGPIRGAWYLFAYNASYLLLFNPRTEANTYALLAPSLGIAVAEAASNHWKASYWLGLLTTLSIIGNYEISKMLIGGKLHCWLAPLGTLLFLGMTFERQLRSFPTRATAATFPVD